MEKVVKIDVLINSCARSDILDVSFRTFQQRIKTSHEFRYVLLEDKVKSKERRRLGREWIEAHSGTLDKVVYAEKKLGPGKFFAPVVALCESDYFFHLEDDNKFIVDVDIDPIIEFMKKHNDVVEILLNRGSKDRHKNLGDKLKVDGVKITEFKLFSVATGVFNTRHVRKIIDDLGWDSRLHEAKTLTPASERLGLKKYVLGHGKKHYIHVGEKKNYIKGKWKKL